MGKSNEQGPVVTRKTKGRPKEIKRFIPKDELPKPKVKLKK
jgi:hypothetical protein